MLRLLSEKEKTEEYPKLFEDCFGYWDEQQIPRDVIVQEEDGEFKGFVSGYMINTDTFYYAWGGVIGNFTGSRRHFNEIYSFLYDNGVRWCQTNVENTNSAWQRMLLGMGWIPHGMKATQGALFIEYYKELEEI